MPNIFSYKMRDFLPFLDPLKSVQKKTLMIDKDILLIARNSDNSESDIGKKILSIFKESLHSAGNFVNFH